MKKTTKKKGPRGRSKKMARGYALTPYGRIRERATQHHRLPRSRIHEFGEPFEGNTKDVPRSLHKAWHRLFGKLTPAEVITKLQQGGKSVFVTDEDSQKAWDRLFPNLTNLEEIIYIIEGYWMGEEVALVLGYNFQYYLHNLPWKF